VCCLRGVIRRFILRDSKQKQEGRDVATRKKAAFEAPESWPAARHTTAQPSQPAKDVACFQLPFGSPNYMY